MISGRNTKISVLILTYNEVKNIRYCLESVKWADEIFIVDSYSTDATLDICKEYNNVKIYQHEFETYAYQRNWALRNLPFSNEWVFSIDADEMMTPELQQELVEIANSPDSEFSGYYVKYRMIFLGKWIRHVSQYPFWLLRFFKHEKAIYERSVNEKLKVDGKCGFLKSDFIHNNRNGLTEWIAKHNRYSTLEAQEYLRLQESKVWDKFRLKDFVHPARRLLLLKYLYVKLPFRSLIRFLYIYIIRMGFLDGNPGFIYSVLSSIQEFHISAKIAEMKLYRKEKSSID